ncbi:MAG: dihydrolipoyl dehydrogenase [Thaumarchaeota archaeon]|nr:dihydrolipoyl dehydrogenase [Nitrososphaerota archaeon]MCL5319130.1 dihydrolipoyl dehydrogenase [Nitrososphaerota archaeon]
MPQTDALKADLAVIGGGPAGCSAAIRGAQLGGKVVIIEASKLGGVCLNTGCIPSKVLLNSARLVGQIRQAEKFGIQVGEPVPDIGQIMARKQIIVKKIVEDLTNVLDRNGVTVVSGRAKIISPKRIDVNQVEGHLKINCAATIVATGSRPASLPIDGVDMAVTTEHLVNLENLPQRIIMLGGGPEGVEFSTALNELGVKVTVVEMMETLLPTEDHEVGRYLERILTERGVGVRVGTTALSISEKNRVKTVSTQGPKGRELLKAELVVLAAGRRPNTENLGLETLSVASQNGWITVNEQMATNVKNLYAVGDVAGGGLAHVASEQGAVAAENALGGASTFDVRVIARCLYTRPEIAAVGLTEEEARAQGLDFKIGRMKMGENDRSTILGEESGFAKILVDAVSKRLLGVYLVGACASEIISEAALAMRLNATVDDIASTTHPYPTVSNALRAAARNLTK